MIKIAIVDDEPDQIKMVTGLIDEFFSTEYTAYNYEIHSYVTGTALLAQLHVGFDLIFLDYQMPHFSGFEIAMKIREADRKVKIIFITGYERYWKDGYKVAAYRYILKPVDKSAFLTDMRDAVKEIVDSGEVIPFRTGSNVLNIAINDILYIHTEKRKTVIHFINKNSASEVVSLRDGINEIETRLQGRNFVRPHISYCVNVRHIRAVRKEPSYRESYLLLSEGTKIFIARGRKRDTLLSIRKFMGETLV